MSIYLHAYTRALRHYDPDLYAGRTTDGIACVFRKVKRFVPAYECEEWHLLNLVEDKQLVFALTDNWLVSGTPRDWGVDYVLGRVRELDSWAQKDFFEKLDAENEKVDERKRREVRNEMEAFWSDQHSRVKKATGEILTHSLSKDNKRKRLQDRSIKNGNY